MYLDSLSSALFQITNAVSNLSKRTFKSYTSEISNLVSEYGPEAERHLIRCLFSSIDFSGDGRTAGKDSCQIQLLSQEFSSFISKPNFISVVCFSIDNPFHNQKSLKPTSHLLQQISRVLRLNTVQEVALGLALQHSNSQELKKLSTQFLKQKLLQLVNVFIETEPRNPGSIEVNVRDAPIELLYSVCSNLQIESFREAVGISVDQKELFFEALKKGYPQDLVPVVLAPFLSAPTFDFPIDCSTVNFEFTPAIMTTSLVDTIQEVGYNFTKSKDQCKNVLIQYGIKSITPAQVARVLGFMARVPVGLQDPLTGQNPFVGSNSNWSEGSKDVQSSKQESWNVEVFITAIKELVPNLAWKDTIKELDHPSFYISNKLGFENLIKGLSLCIDNFPIGFVYNPWKNKEGQMSWISSALKYPEVFCFANFSSCPVDVSCLKNPPDEKNRDIVTWKSMDLINILLQLSDEGFQSQVLDLFKFPMTQCPDLLLIGILQSPCWNVLKQEMICSLLPVFLGQHNNALSVMNFTWHVQGGQSPTVRTMVLRSMADWYMRDLSDSTRLARVLDMAQDLKALSTLLGMSPFPFVIDLACLAARREYLKLDKWMNDKIRDHGETFVEECVSFIMTKASHQLGFTKEDSQAINNKSAPIPHIESHHLNIMLTCLQNYVATNRNASASLQEAVLKMVQSFKQKQQQQQQQPGQIPSRVAAAGPSLTTVSIPNSQQTDHGPNLNALGFSAFSLNPANNPAMNPHPQFPRPGAPGSPAKGFNVMSAGAGQMGQQALSNQQLYNSSGISSQLQGLNLHSSISNGYGAGPMIGSQLGAAAAAAHGLNGSGLNNNPNLNSSLSSSLLAGQNATFSGLQAGFGAPALSTLSTAALGHSRQQQGMAGLAGMDSSGAMSNQQYSKEVEDEANSYFKRIFNNSSSSASNTTCVAPMTVDELLELMKRFKNSINPREAEVYSCMMRNLYEEYKFFSQYPERELLTTANLFGGLIEYGLVSFVTLGFALRCTLEALKKPGGKMYTFGLTALDKFKTKLKEYPQYCQYLSMLPTFNDFPQTLKEYITYGSQSMDAPHPALPAVSSVPSPTAATTTLAIVSSQASVHSIIAATTAAATHGAISRPANSSYRSSIANATNIDTLLANKEGMDNVVVPNEALQDKVFFIFNNLSQANMDQKAKEMNEQVGDEFMAWVAQYLVMKRASTEHNFHTLYTNFIEHLHKSAFLEMVIAETYRNIKVLLRSDKGVANFSDRTLLKNLGHWLGMIMLAKNKPILQVDLDLKAMVYEAFVKGPDELLYVVPFVAKVLESAIRSRVFRPPNPWTMAIMNVLSELHREPELKLNLKFEIEVLCKNLQIDINELEPGNYLKDPSRLSGIVPQLSPNKHRKVDTTPLPEENMDMGVPIQAPPPATPTQQHQQVTNIGGSVVEVLPMQQQYGGATGYPQQEINAAANTSGVSTTSSPATGTLSHHIVISDQINLFHIHPHLKQYVKPAIERAIQEMLPPAVEKAVSIAIKSADIIIKKDFSLEPDENKMRMAAHQFVRFMTAGMALITCHEPIMVSIINNLKTVFSTALRMPTPQQKEMIDAAANIIAQDNAELATVFVQKTAVEKAIPDIDKRLQGEYEARRTAKQEGRHYYDQSAYLAQERLPEKIRLRLGGVSQAQMAVYEEFTRNIPGFVPTINEHSLQVVHSQIKNMQSYGAEDVLQMYDKVSRDLEQSLGMLNGSPLQALLQQLLDQVLQTRNSARDVNSAIILLQRAVEGLMEGLLMTAIPGAHETVDQTTRFRDCHLLVLKFLQDVRVYGHQWTNKQVTRCLVECREELRYSIDAVCALLQSQLVVISHYDSFLASLVDGNNYNAIPFAMQIVQRFCIESDKHHEMRIHEGDFGSTIESLQKAVLHSRGPETLPSLLDSVRQHSTESGLIDRSVMTAPTMMHSGIAQAHEFNDPPGFQEKADYLIREWVNTFHSASSLRDNNKSFNQFINHMWFQGILKTDELITRFFRVSTESCVGMCYRLLNDPSQNPTRVRFQCFNTLDAFVKLIVLLLKNSGDPNNNITKVNLLNKVLGVVTGVLVQDHEMKKTEFYPLPYHRIFIMLFIELNAPDQILEPLNLDVLTAFSNVLHILRPAKVASFTFAWLEIISHRVFVGKMLALNRNQKTWGMYAQLIVDLFNFMAPYLRNADLPKPIHQLYKGTMKVFLVLLHDFPELFVEYHYALCDAIPTNCIQIRNLVLSAYPKNMRLPDPFTPNLRVEMMPDINSAPRIATNYVANIQPLSLKRDLDSYLNTRKPVTFLSDLRSRLQVSNTPGVKYNIPLLNSLVLHVGTQAINHIYAKGLAPSVSTIAHSSHMDIFQNLAVDLDTEGRYLFLNAMANHLRFPNSHTQYFSSTLLYLFAEANTEAIQEQITRVLLERLMVNRPHPWGLLLTFIELLKNPSYKFWNHEFVRCAPEIERLLDSVARSCSHGKTMTRDVDSGDVR